MGVCQMRVQLADAHPPHCKRCIYRSSAVKLLCEGLFIVAAPCRWVSAKCRYLTRLGYAIARAIGRCPSSIASDAYSQGRNYLGEGRDNLAGVLGDRK